MNIIRKENLIQIYNNLYNKETVLVITNQISNELGHDVFSHLASLNKETIFLHILQNEVTQQLSLSSGRVHR